MTDNGSQADATADQSAEKFPQRLRVHALARTLGLTSKQVLVHLQEMGVTARTAQSSISRADAQAVELRIVGAADGEGADTAVVAAATAAVEPAASAPKSSLFSAVEPVEPVAAAPSEATAPLFLEADKPAKGAKKTAKKAAKDAASKDAAAKDAAAKDAADVPAADVTTADAKPAKKAGKKAGAKKSKKAAASVEPAPVEPAVDEPVADEQKPVEEQKPVAEAPVEIAQEQTAPESDETASIDTDQASDQDSDSDVSAESSESDDEHGESRSRRRRRGRRGRGRGRGDQGADGEHADESADEDQPAATAEDTASVTDDAVAAPKSASTPADSNQADAGDDAGESDSTDDNESAAADDNEQAPSSKRRRRRRRRRGGAEGTDGTDDEAASTDDPPNTVVHEREPRTKRVRDEVQGISGSTRLEAKRQRRRDGRDAGRRRPPILTESEFLARRESVERVMVVRERSANTAITSAEPHAAPAEDYTQIAVLEDGVLVEHFVTTETSQSMVGNIYLGRVQNVLPGMEAAFVDVGRGRNGVLYAGEVNWEAAGLDGGSRKIEQALKPGDHVLVQVSKDPIGHKGARLTTQISLAGRYLVYVPGGTSTGISRKLPDTERKRLKQILAKVVPAEAGVIIRTASEGVSAEDLGGDIERLEAQWKRIEAAASEHKAKAPGTPKALYEEPDLLVRVVRDLFNEDFRKLVIEGDRAWAQVSGYVGDVAPDLSERLEEFTKNHADAPDSFSVHRIDEQLAKALDRKVWLPSGGTLIIEHTEAMTVVDVNTGKFTGSGGNLEETVTRNNLEAAEEIVRQMRLRDIGGMIIVDFIDMVLESNRDLVLRRLTESLARDRTRHQVSEVTSLGLVQMTRKRLGTGLLEAFSTTCTACSGRGVIVHTNPVEVHPADDANRGGGSGGDSASRRSRRSRRRGSDPAPDQKPASTHNEPQPEAKPTANTEQPKAPHKPAAEHPMFRAMAHPEHDDHVVAAEAEAPNRAPAVAEAPEPATNRGPAESPAAPAVTVGRRRRRAVRKTSAPTVVDQPVETSVPEKPVTSVTAQSSAPIVAVKRSPRRRSGRRVAGPPPGDE